MFEIFGFTHVYTQEAVADNPHGVQTLYKALFRRAIFLWQRLFVKDTMSICVNTTKKMVTETLNFVNGHGNFDVC